MTVYFKLVNHDRYTKHVVSHYFCNAPFPTPWHNLVAGGTLPVFCNIKQQKSMDVPQSGDLLVLFQNVFGTSQVVTHLLEFGTTETEVCEYLPGWPGVRKCKILSQLHPGRFGGEPSPAEDSLVSTNISRDSVRLHQLLGLPARPTPTIPNGRVYSDYMGHYISQSALALIQPGTNGFV